MPIFIDDKNLKRSIDFLSQYFKRRQQVFARIGWHMRDYVRDTIRMGGRGEPFAPLSDWTIARTGRTRPLITLADRIQSRSTNDDAQVYFAPIPGKNFTINQHHRGYTRPAIVGLQVVPIKKGLSRYFMSSQAIEVPARKIWPTGQETSKEITKYVHEWINSGAKANWR